MPKMTREEKAERRQQTDGTDAVVSACECTGMLPSMPEEEKEETVCRMMHVHAQPRRRKKR